MRAIDSRPLAALAVILALASLSLPPYYTGIAVMVAVFALFALSVDLVFGRLGYVTFGHAAFFGLGAYATALLTLHGGLHVWLAAIVAILPCALLGALIGFASLRVGGAYFAIASLTAAEILHLVAGSWMDVTRGPLGLIVPPPAFPWAMRHGIGGQHLHLALIIVLVALAYAVVGRLSRSPVGRSWLAIRESVNLAESIGIPTLRARVINLSLSGGLAGLAGGLLVPKILVVSPDLLSPTYSAMALLMVILGGRGTLLGPLLGGILFAVLPETFRAIDEYRLAVFAVLILVMIRLQPDGMVAWLEAGLRYLRKRRAWPAGAGRTAVAPARPDAGDLQALVPQAESGPILTVSALSKSFVGLKAVSGLSFDVRAGEIVGLIGPNGAGKTTSLSLISGFMKPSAGRVTFRGGDLSSLPPNRVAQCGLVRTFQQAEIYQGLTASENVLVGTHLVRPPSLLACMLQRRAYRNDERARQVLALQALSLVGLADRADIAARELAYGEQRLLAIAQALAAQPRMLLLDEPAAGLNQTEAQTLGRLLRQLQGAGMTILLVEHNMDLVMSVADRIVVLHHGEVVSIGTPAEIRENPVVQAAYLGGSDDMGDLQTEEPRRARS
jgi:branched-chain amino acid transport system permease protein